MTTGVLSSDFNIMGILVNEVNHVKQKGDVIDREHLVREIFRCLPERPRQILRMRWGFDTGHEMSFTEIGAEIGMAGDDAWQMYDATLKELRFQVQEVDIFLEEMECANLAVLCGLAYAT